jgi:HD-GYP domain-containing protein (c-di-GMP phosphodiesterase class II)
MPVTSELKRELELDKKANRRRATAGALPVVPLCVALSYASNILVQRALMTQSALSQNIELVGGLADIVPAAIVSVFIFIVLRRYVAEVLAAKSELKMAEREIIERLGLAAEYRDDETGQHITRMSHMCAVIGRQLGLSQFECERLRLASSLHDIGKIAIPDSVMLKDGPFTPQERHIMQRHTIVGAGMLAGGGTQLVRIAEKIALNHHERWDGSGYPYGISGDDIPLEGRIAAIADVFDALTSPRRYKSAWTVEEAVSYIESESGKHFDPAVVDAFLAVLPELKAIKAKFEDRAGPSGREQLAA